MKNQYLSILIPLTFLACGNGNIESNTSEIRTNEEITENEVKQVEILRGNDSSVFELTDSNEHIEEKKGGVEKMEKISQMDQPKEEVLQDKAETIVEKKEPVELSSSEKSDPIKEVKEIVLKKANHMVWDDLVKSYVSATGKVDYKGMKSNLSKLESYLKQLSALSPGDDWSKYEKLAYWINLYNAATVYLISSNYPVKSITNLNGGKPWDKKFIKSGNSIYSLNEIENSIIRPRFNEPRIHVALNCAAKSCPSLLNEAFVPARLNDQLNKQSKVWVNDPSKNKIEKGSIAVSKIFEWYGEDFKTSGGIVGFVKKYASKEVSNNATITYLEYDWSLNE